MPAKEFYIDRELKKLKETYMSLGSHATMTKAMQIYMCMNPARTYDIRVEAKRQERERLIRSLIADLDLDQYGEVLMAVLLTRKPLPCVYIILSMLPITSSSEHKNFIDEMLSMVNSRDQYSAFMTAMIENSDSQKYKYMVASMLYNRMHVIEEMQEADEIEMYDDIIMSTLTNISETLAETDDADQRKIVIAALLEGVEAEVCKDIIVSLLPYTYYSTLSDDKRYVKYDKQLSDYILHEAKPYTEQTKNMIYSMILFSNFQQHKDIISYMITTSNYHQAKHMMDAFLYQTCDYQQRKDIIAGICRLGCQNNNFLFTMVYSMLDNSEELYHESMIREMLEVNRDAYFSDSKFRNNLLEEVLFPMIYKLLSKHPGLSPLRKYYKAEKIIGMLLDSESDDMLLRYIADLTRRDLQSIVEDVQDLPDCCAFWHMRL